MDVTQRIDELERALGTLCLGIDAVQLDTASADDWIGLNKAAHQAAELLVGSEYGPWNFKRFPTLNGSPSLPPQSPSSSSPPSSHPPKAPGLSQAKKEKKQRLTLKSVLDAVRPDLTLQSPSFVDAWTRWVENRLQLPKPTLGAFQIHMAKCATLGERRAIAAINRSIESSWLSIFEDKPQPQNKRSESCL